MSTLALQLWRSICQRAPVQVIDGRKHLVLTEEACIAMGSSLEGSIQWNADLAPTFAPPAGANDETDPSLQTR